jgi:hypothetical protein
MTLVTDTQLATLIEHDEQLRAQLEHVRGQRDLVIEALTGLLEPATDEQLAKFTDDVSATLVCTVGELRRARAALKKASGG